MSKMRLAVLGLLIGGLVATPTPAAAQLGGLKKKIKQKVERAADKEVDEALSKTENEIRCTAGDSDCIAKAKKDGKTVVVVNQDGEVVDSDAAADAAPSRPGEGVWANYDFVPGNRILFAEDFSQDRVGDFPRRLEFMRGNWEIVEWEGRRLLRNTGPRHAAVKILLPHELPESFTIELDAHFTHGNHRMIVATTPPKPGANWSSLEGNFFQIGVAHGTGVATRVRGGIESTNRSVEVENGVVPIRIMVDGRYAKVYVQERRVANIPNAEFRRSAEIYIENIYSGSEENPLYLGPIRIAEGGRDLYDKLAEDGRVATQGILFAVNSSEIRPESTPTLEEIGTMLQEHEDLRIRIEGHTDATGDDASNQTLSEERADAVRRFLVDTYGIDESRLESQGFGESSPVDTNDTPEGQQNNRRVELIKL
jgi:outer membrane protein OmpA-like peptidoglycan-associated protein